MQLNFDWSFGNFWAIFKKLLKNDQKPELRMSWFFTVSLIIVIDTNFQIIPLKFIFLNVYSPYCGWAILWVGKTVG